MHEKKLLQYLPVLIRLQSNFQCLFHFLHEDLNTANQPIFIRQIIFSYLDLSMFWIDKTTVVVQKSDSNPLTLQIFLVLFCS